MLAKLQNQTSLSRRVRPRVFEAVDMAWVNDVHLHRARELGGKIAIDSDAHQVGNLAFVRYGVDQARRGWIEKKQVLNTMTWKQLQWWLERRA